MIASLERLAEEARTERRGLGAFNVIHLENAEAFVRAAEEADLPFVLQISENAVAFHGGDLAPLAHAVLCLARSSSARVCVHLDHAKDLDLIRSFVARATAPIL